MRLRYTIKRNGLVIQSYESSERDFHEYYLPSLGPSDEVLVTVYFDGVEIGQLFLKR
jgi:hypothetical protein